MELSMTVPAQAHFAPMARELGAHGARFLGRSEDDACAMGRKTEAAFRQIAGTGRGDVRIRITVNPARGAMEIVIEAGGRSQTIALDQ